MLQFFIFVCPYLLQNLLPQPRLMEICGFFFNLYQKTNCLVFNMIYIGY